MKEIIKLRGKFDGKVEIVDKINRECSREKKSERDGDRKLDK